MTKKHAVRVLSSLSLMLAAVPAAQAVAISDPAGDFLATLVLPSGVTTADIGYLDVLSAEVTFDSVAATFTFSADVNGAIPGVSTGLPNTTGFYVWGINRGGGTERFLTNTPAVGDGVSFDSVVIVRRDGSITVNDLLAPTATTNLAAGTASISGSHVSATISAALLPAEAPGNFTPAQYLWNLWPRYSTTGGTTAITDFAPNELAGDPNAANALVTTVPEPGAAALMGLGLVGLLAAARRR